LTKTVEVKDDTYTFTQTNDPMNILFVVHGYTDTMGSGAERMVQTMSEFFVKRGHKVTVGVKRNAVDLMNGVKLEKVNTKAFNDAAKRFDVVVSHLDLTGYAQDLARDNRKPFFWICHNTIDYPLIRKRPKHAYVIYNSEWAKAAMEYPCEHFVLPPPSDYRQWDDGLDHYDQPYITLVNHNLNKGGAIFIKIAKAMPERQFLAVAGSYDVQIYDKNVPNITYIEQQKDMSEVYGKSRVVLMPSEYESWGLVACEAGSAGIPVIACRTSGLWENMLESGVYVDDRKNIDQWVEKIKMLDDKKVYSEVSKKIRERMREQDPYKRLHELETWMNGIRKQNHK
jgi:glycosyltransferase involved in cell wall biosynthesis